MIDCKKMRNNITPEEFMEGIEKFRENEPRDAMYEVAIHLIKEFWPKNDNLENDDAINISYALGVLLLTWNQAFYRYGIFDFEKLRETLKANWDEIKSFRKKELKNSPFLHEEDKSRIKKLFNKFLEALGVTQNGKTKKSPVAVAKALHLLAPHFFPLWDRKIAEAYVDRYLEKPAEKYIEFTECIYEFIQKLENFRKDSELKNFLGKYEAKSIEDIGPKTRKFSILKLIDEYNYARFTKGWIKEVES